MIHERNIRYLALLAALTVLLLTIPSCGVQHRSAPGLDRFEGIGDCDGELLPEHVTCEALGWPRSKRPRLVIDAFAFNGEFRMLDARMRELEQVVNYTAVLTTAANFHGQKNKEWQLPALPNLFHRQIPAGAFDECDSGADSKAFAKCAMAVAKNSVATVVDEIGASGEDWVLFSDADEIPNREAVRLLHECEIPSQSGDRSMVSVRFGSVSHYTYHTKCLSDRSRWVNIHNVITPVTLQSPEQQKHKKPVGVRGPIAVKLDTMHRFGLRTFQLEPVGRLASGGNVASQTRCAKNGPYASCNQRDVHEMSLSCSAWHFSSFSGLESMKRKMRDNADEWEALSDEDVAAAVNQCSEHNQRRQNHQTKNGFVTVADTVTFNRLNASMQKRYPAVPHSVASDAERFASFFDFWSEQ